MVKSVPWTGLIVLALIGVAATTADSNGAVAPTYGKNEAPTYSGNASLTSAAAPAPATPPVTQGAKAAPDPTVAIHKALQAIYDSQDAALARHDVRQAMAGYAPGYTAIGQDGSRHTRDEEFDALERVCALGQDVSQHSRIERTITQGGQASLVLHQETTMPLFSTNTHQQIVLHTEGVRQDVWLHTTQGWRLTFSKTVLQRISTSVGALLGVGNTPRTAIGASNSITPRLSAAPNPAHPKLAPRLRPHPRTAVAWHGGWHPQVSRWRPQVNRWHPQVSRRWAASRFRGRVGVASLWRPQIFPR